MTAPARPTSEGEAARVSEHWEHQFAKNRADNSLWTNNQIVARHIYRLISNGGEEHWLSWFLNKYLPSDLIFERSFSVCCGDGYHELALAKTGRIKFIRAFDISGGAIEQANAAFVAAGIPEDNYRFEVADADDLQIDDRFDLILSTGALHHVSQLETLLARLGRMLEPHGYFVVLEYVGPNRFQWRDPQLDVINAILQRLDPRYLKENRRLELSRPRLTEFLAIDPSEAVRSEEVLRVLDEQFTIEYLRNFNGTVVHPLYPLLNAEFTNTGDHGFDSALRIILLMEDLLVRQGVLTSDFVFAVCRHKTLSARIPSAPKGDPRRLVGYLDAFDATQIAGWAADLFHPAAVVMADLYFDDQFHATVRCDIFRRDLLEAGYGDGRKSFSLPLMLPEKPRPVLARLVLAGSDEVLATRGQSLAAASGPGR